MTTAVKMDTSIKQKWVDALRSGDYQRGTLKFRDDATGRYCCLGVLCEVMGEPTELDHIAGNWPYVNRVIGSPQIASELASMNDAGMPFAEIAAHIEENL